jgi:hypothetical protein
MLLVGCNPFQAPKEEVPWQYDYHMKKAIKFYGKMIDMEGCLTDKRGVCELLLKDAEAEYLAASKYNPDSYIPLSNIAGMHFFMGDLVKSREYALKAYDLNHKDSESTKLLADINLLEEKNEEALLWLKKHLGTLDKNGKAQIGIEEMETLEKQLAEDPGNTYYPVNNWQMEMPGWRVTNKEQEN